MNREEIETRYAAGERVFTDVKLADINLKSIHLSGANLSRANLIDIY
ncbi:pentapeptide repeat-containing protein [Calothrix sp. CCY 0018]